MPHTAFTSPSFSLALTRRVLDQIYDDFTHSRRHPLSDGHGFDDIAVDDALMTFPDNTECPAPVDDVISTAAEQLSSAIIANDQTDGIDPFAIDDEGISRMPSRQMPLSEMIFAARFTALLQCPEKVAAMAKPQAVTMLCLPSSDEREVFKDLFPDIFAQTAKALMAGGIDLRAVAIAPFPYVTKRPSTDPKIAFGAIIEQMIAKGESVIAIAPAVSDLPPSGRTLFNASHFLPPIDANMVIEILRQTHSATGQLSDDFVRDCLPSDADLQALSMPLLQAAFFEDTTIMVARRLKSHAGTVEIAPHSASPGIADMYLPANVKEDMAQLIDDLALWRDGSVDWSEVISSILLYGPPGTGKTMLANSLAATTDIPLITASYGECQRAGHQGDFLRVLSEKVEQAIAAAPAILFIDELDSFYSRTRSSRSSGYVIAIVNALLEHLTVLNETPGVIVIGATNFIENVDPAILRPGRFDLHIPLSSPDRDGITQLFTIDLGDTARQFDIQTAVDRMLGKTGAQIAALLRDARGKARRAKAPLNNTHLTAALDRIAPETRTTDLERVAVHEAGHVVVAHALGWPLPRTVRITSRGGQYVTTKPFAATKQSIDDQIVILMAGRAAEASIIGKVSDGAADDLEQATELAFRARYSWGLYGNNLLALNYKKMATLDPLSPLGSVVNTDLKNHYTRAKELAQDHENSIRRVADALLEHREMGGSALAELLEVSACRDVIRLAMNVVER
ncbi:MAG: AAA family ATPase [Hyphomicrobiales bacterium]